MKKIIAGILAAALVLSVGIVSAFAAGPDTGRNFVDADGDGVCDNCGTGMGRGAGGQGLGFVDADGDGICDNYGTGAGRGAGGQGRGFVDADGDGICDNYGTGAGCGFRGGRGR